MTRSGKLKGVPWGEILAAGAVGLACGAGAAPGDLDTTFGSGGTVITNFGSFADDNAITLVIQSDGKLVAAGLPGNDFGLARYNPDGSLDSTFGAGSKVTTDFGGSKIARALVLQPDGKLVAAGDRRN